MTEPRTLTELVDFIETHAERIYVREQIGGVWSSYALTEMPAAMAIHHALRFIRERRVPVIVKPDAKL